MNPSTIWLDTDPGVDDWIAWLLLATQPQLRIAGVSVVAGNAPLKAVLNNALRIRAFHRWTMPVHAGAAGPLNPRSTTTAEEVLGAGAMTSSGRLLPPPINAPTVKTASARCSLTCARPKVQAR